MMSFEVIVLRKRLDRCRAWRQKVHKNALTGIRTWRSRDGLDALALMSQTSDGRKPWDPETGLA